MARAVRSVLLAVLLGPGLARAEVVALLPVTGANVDAGTLEAARDVFRSHLERTGREVRLAGADATREATPAEAGAAARSVGASRAAALRLVLLGSVLRARLAVYDPSGRVVHVDDMPGGSPADIDPMLQRLAQGYAASSSAARVAEIETVTDREALELKKMRSTHNRGIRLGAMLPVDPRRPAGAGGGFFWQYDARSFMVDVSWDLWGTNRELSGTTGASYLDTALGFGAYLPLGRGDLTPYLGGGLRYAISRHDGDWAAGLQPYAAGGLWMGRLSTTQVRLEVGGFYDLYTNAGRNIQGFRLSAAVAL